MGKVIATLTITNRANQRLANRGYMPPADVRSMTLDNDWGDTGATTLCLPAEAIAPLGLELLKEVRVATATGESTARIFRDADIQLLGCEGPFECWELPGGRDPRLAVVPLDMQGSEPDLKNPCLKVLPDNPRATYLTIM